MDTSASSLPAHNYIVTDNFDCVNDSTQLIMAKTVVENKKICFGEEMDAYMVEGTCGNKYGITLLPKPKCSCASPRICYHIIYVQLLKGTYKKHDLQLLNLTEAKAKQTET